MDEKERLELIKRNTAEIILESELKDLLKRKKKPVAYLGWSITGSPHTGYLLPALKIADLLNVGFKVKVLLADLHGALDNTPWDLLDKRYKYYEKIIPLLIRAVGADVKNLELVKGSSFQLKREFMLDVLKMSTFTSIRDANKAASEVVKMGVNPKLSGLLYPIMQALDEEHLGADVQIGGTDQRKIMVLARENLPKLGYKARVELMHPLIMGLTEGGKMSASVEESKIDLLDDEKTVKNKINRAYIVAGNPKNGIMEFLRYITFTIKGDKKEKFVVERDKKYGGNLSYGSYEDLERDFVAKKVHPQDLKNAAAKEINLLLTGIRKKRKELEKLKKAAYR